MSKYESYTGFGQDERGNDIERDDLVTDEGVLEPKGQLAGDLTGADDLDPAKIEEIYDYIEDGHDPEHIAEVTHVVVDVVKKIYRMVDNGEKKEDVMMAVRKEEEAGGEGTQKDEIRDRGDGPGEVSV